jgi:hypothetical protein
MTFNVPRISRTTLWNAWKAIRQQVHRFDHRDPADYLEYDIDPDVWINRLLKQIASGNYAPHAPKRYTVAKANGFSRTISMPHIPDLVLYRAIVDHLFLRARHQQKKHVYFQQATLSRVAARAFEQAQGAVRQVHDGDPAYPVVRRDRFLEWLRFDQYRKLLIFDRTYPFIVLTDISNFFDSIVYGRIEQSLYGLRASPKLIGLLFFLLERLSPRESYTSAQRIGLPVDQCDCSRNLAHMMLFPHDERMVELVGEDAYVRWMDDQNIGVATRAEGLRVLAAVGQSLARLHLTPNAGKSKILPLAAAKRHFHFRANALLDQIHKMPFRSRADRSALRRPLIIAWHAALVDEDVGEWPKILRRFYRYGARARARFMRSRARRDILAHPSLTSRVCEYLHYSSSVIECINFAQTVLAEPEQIYPDVSYQLLDWLLRLEPSPVEARLLQRFFQSIYHGRINFSGREMCRSLVPLALLRYGDKRSIKSLSGQLGQKLDKLSAEEVRSIALVLAGFGDPEFHIIANTASRLLLNHLAEFVRMIHRIRRFGAVPNRLKNRIRLAKDSITFRTYLDMRTLITLRLLRLNRRPMVSQWIANRKTTFLNQLSLFDQRLLNRTL